MSPTSKVLILAAVAACAFALGKSTAKVKIETREVVRIVEVEKKAEHTKKVETRLPDGTTTITTVSDIISESMAKSEKIADRVETRGGNEMSAQIMAAKSFNQPGLHPALSVQYSAGFLVGSAFASPALSTYALGVGVRF